VGSGFGVEGCAGVAMAARGAGVGEMMWVACDVGLTIASAAGVAGFSNSAGSGAMETVGVRAACCGAGCRLAKTCGSGRRKSARAPQTPRIEKGAMLRGDEMGSIGSPRMRAMRERRLTRD
jgi:hypothetical protein